MLVFNGDGKQEPEATTSISTAKPPRRPHRKISVDEYTSTPFQTPVTQRPTALELLSQTAPAAPSSHQRQKHVSLTKRKLVEITRTMDRPVLSSRRKVSKPMELQQYYQERVDSAALPPPVLPFIDPKLHAEYNPSRPDQLLSKLCRSLTHAAVSAEREATPGRHSNESPIPSFREFSQSGSSEGAISPATEDLLCEEAIEVATREPIQIRRQEDRSRSIAVQERAVLQEFSVWLRNLTTMPQS